VIVKVLKDITAFRDEIAQHELEHILKAADANVSVDDNKSGPNSCGPDEEWDGTKCVPR